MILIVKGLIHGQNNFFPILHELRPVSICACALRVLVHKKWVSTCLVQLNILICELAHMASPYCMKLNPLLIFSCTTDSKLHPFCIIMVGIKAIM